MSVPRAIRNQDAILACERRDLAVERINPISPSAVKNDERLAAAKLPVVDGDGFHAGGVRRLRQLQSRHLVLPLQREKWPDARGASSCGRVHCPHITNQKSPTQSPCKRKRRQL